MRKRCQCLSKSYSTRRRSPISEWMLSWPFTKSHQPALKSWHHKSSWHHRTKTAIDSSKESFKQLNAVMPAIFSHMGADKLGLDFCLWPLTSKIDVRSNVGYWEARRTRSTHSELFGF